MCTPSEQIIASSERVFDCNGFTASGMDTLTQAAGVSTRTLYKHIGSKSELITAVLRLRSARFFTQLDTADTVDDLFGSLEQWIRSEGARGCLFLRAAGELGDGFPDAQVEIADYRRRLVALIRDLVWKERGYRDDLLAEQILLLFEGATSAASYRGVLALSAARKAAASLMRQPQV